MENIEIWKDIQGYENLYQISSFGNVKSLGNGGSNKSKEKLLKQRICKGYFNVGLCKDGKQKKYQVHRLVAQAFLDNPNNYPQVNHKNEIKIDNCISNLEWCTQAYNNNYGTRLERHSKTMKGKTHTQKTKDKMSISHQISIVQIHQSGLIVGVYDSAKEVSEVLGINRGDISSCLKGKQKTAGGFKFKYLNELKKAG
jgi:hypothetical protein